MVRLGAGVGRVVVVVRGGADGLVVGAPGDVVGQDGIGLGDVLEARDAGFDRVGGRGGRVGVILSRELRIES